MHASAATVVVSVATAAPEIRGASMALYSMVGFAGAVAGSLAIGGVLDALGGQSIGSWAAAFATMGRPGIVGVVLMRRAGGAPQSTCYSG